ncbi:hypothetical protein ZWY2020_011650 [Hordeum vulgare]|nr:hypothetical protein ZWY2020_011650 [Hordeum vulgare]
MLNWRHQHDSGETAQHSQAQREAASAPGKGDSRTAHANRLQPRGRWGDDGVNAYGDGQHRGSSSSGGDRGYAWQNNGASGNGFIALPGKFVPGTSGPTHLKRGGLRLNWASRGGGRKPRPPLPTQESSTDLDESTLATATEPVKEVADPAMADHSLAIAKGDGGILLVHLFYLLVGDWVFRLPRVSDPDALSADRSLTGPDNTAFTGEGISMSSFAAYTALRRQQRMKKRRMRRWVPVLDYISNTVPVLYAVYRILKRNTEMKIVLWGQRAIEFEAQLIYDNGQETAVVGVFVGLLMKSYKNDETLSGGSACRWYLNEDLPEIDDYFERFRLCMEGTDGTAAAEFVFFNRVAQQLVGKSVMSLLRSSGLPREIAAVVSQKYTLAISVTQKSLSQRNISFQVNGIETFFEGKTLPLDTRTCTVMPLLIRDESSAERTRVQSTEPISTRGIPDLPITTESVLKKTTPQRVPLRNLKGKILLLPLTAAVQPFQHHPWNHQLSRVLTALHMVDQKSS